MIVDNIADIGLLIIVAGSSGIGIRRGFAKETLMLASLIASIYIAYRYGSEVGSYCTFLTAAVLRQGFGYFLAFSLTSLLTAAIRAPILRVLGLESINMVDRMAGAIFGLARGGIMAALLIAALTSTPIVHQPWWEDSFLIPHIEHSSEKAMAQVPEKWKKEVMALVEKLEVEYA